MVTQRKKLVVPFVVDLDEEDLLRIDRVIRRAQKDDDAMGDVTRKHALKVFLMSGVRRFERMFAKRQKLRLVEPVE